MDKSVSSSLIKTHSLNLHGLHSDRGVRCGPLWEHSNQKRMNWNLNVKSKLSLERHLVSAHSLSHSLSFVWAQLVKKVKTAVVWRRRTLWPTWWDRPAAGVALALCGKPRRPCRTLYRLWWKGQRSCRCGENQLPVSSAGDRGRPRWQLEREERRVGSANIDKRGEEGKRTEMDLRSTERSKMSNMRKEAGTRVY